MGIFLGFCVSYFLLYGWPLAPGKDVMSYLFYFPAGIGLLSIFQRKNVVAPRPLMTVLPIYLLFVGVVFWLFVSRYDGEIENTAFLCLLIGYWLYLLSLERFYVGARETLGLWHTLIAASSLSALLLFSGSSFLSQMSGIFAAILLAIFVLKVFGLSGALDYYWTEFFAAGLIIISLAGVLYMDLSWWRVLILLSPSIAIPWLLKWLEGLGPTARFLWLWFLPVVAVYVPLVIHAFL